MTPVWTTGDRQRPTILAHHSRSDCGAPGTEAGRPASATVTGKGQFTIPLEVRTLLGLRPGSRLAFVPTGTGGYEIRPVAASVQELKDAVTRPAHPVDIDGMNEVIAAAASADAR